MKKRDISLVRFIKENCNIELSDMLEAYIREPTRLHIANKNTLLRLVVEYRPIYQKYKHILDGPIELSKLCTFEIFLMGRIRNNAELIALLNFEDNY